jgi:hypothetical protein
MAASLVINIKIPLPEGSLLDQGATLAAIKSTIDALKEALPSGYEYSDKIARSSSKPRKPRTPRAVSRGVMAEAAQ